MASMSVLSLPLALVILFSFAVADQPTAALIHETCKASRDPATCEKWLSDNNSTHLPQNATVLDIIQSTLNLTADNLHKGREMVQTILQSSQGNLNRTNAANTCLEELGFADYRVGLVRGAVPYAKKLKDARAWMGASLVYQYDCWSALKYVNDTSLVRDTMVFFNDTLIVGASNALAMIANYELFGDKTASWGPVKTERNGFWGTGSDSSSGSSVGPSCGVPRGLKPNVTVCKEGQCDYATVQDAINGAPDNDGSGKHYVIWVKTGLYDEIVRVPLEKRNLVLSGDGMGKTVITGSKNVGQPGLTTYNTATFGVAGDGFMAKDLTIRNTAGPNAHQAVAFRSDSDRSIIEDCEFVGNQDTLYAHSLRQYYKSCLIQGNVDFIFGFSASFFQDCTILVAPRQVNPDKGENNAVTAQGRTDPAQPTGFVFQNCLINGTEDYVRLYYSNPKVHRNFLGRPWKEYSRTVFINSTLEVIVAPEGWLPWDKDFALETLYYGEFGNKGKGADTSKRVAWSNQIPAEHVGAYSIENFIQADQWMDSFVRRVE